MEKKIIQETKYQYVCGKCQEVFGDEQRCVEHEKLCGREFLKFYKISSEGKSNGLYIRPGSYSDNTLLTVELYRGDYEKDIEDFNNGDKDSCVSYVSRYNLDSVMKDESAILQEFVDGLVSMYLYELIDGKLVKI
jgi:hypothetical protein